MLCTACGHDHEVLEGCNLVIPLGYSPPLVESTGQPPVLQGNSLPHTGPVQSFPLDEALPEQLWRDPVPQTIETSVLPGFVSIRLVEYERLLALEVAAQVPCAVCERRRISNRDYQRRQRENRTERI